MNNQEQIKTKVLNWRNKGFTDGVIIDELLREGYLELDVLKSIQKISSPSNSYSGFVKAILIVVFLTFLIGSTVVFVSNILSEDSIFLTEEYKVGVMLDFSSSEANTGASIKNSVELALADLENEEFLDGKRISLVYRDSRCDKDIASEVVSELINEHQVIAIIGGLCSSETLGLATLANLNEVVAISPSSTSPLITTQGGDYVFRVAPSDINQAKEIIKLVKSNNHKKIAMLYVNDAYGVGLFEELKDGLTEPDIEIFDLLLSEDINPKEILGKYVTGDIEVTSSFEIGERLFDKQINDIKNKDPDIIIMIAHPEDGAFMIRKLRTNGIETGIIASEALQNNIIFEIVQKSEDTDGINIFVPSIVKTSKYNSYLSSYNDLYLQDPSVWSAQGYDALQLIAKAIFNGAKSGRDIKVYLSQMSPYSGISGTINFDDNGDLVDVNYDLIEIRNQEFIVID